MTSDEPGILQRTRLPDQVALTLLREIVGGCLPPQTQLPTEPALGQRFGVSRTVVREALRMLAAKGLIEVRHGRGVWVTPPASWDPLDIEIMRVRFERGDLDETWWHFYDARTAIEVGTAALAAERRNETDLQALRGALEQMRQAAQVLDRYRRADVDFHVSLVRAAHNPVLLRILEPVHTLLRAGGMPPPLISVQSALCRHQEVLAAIERGDAEEARRAMARLFPRRDQAARQPSPRAAASDGGSIAVQE